MKKVWIWFVSDPSCSCCYRWVAAREFHLQASSSTRAVVKSRSHCESEEHEHQTEFKLQHCLIHMLLPTFLVDCWQLRLTQKQKPISSSCSAQKFQLIWHWRKVEIKLLWWLSVTKGFFLCKWDSYLATLPFQLLCVVEKSTWLWPTLSRN